MKRRGKLATIYFDFTPLPRLMTTSSTQFDSSWFWWVPPNPVTHQRAVLCSQWGGLQGHRCSRQFSKGNGYILRTRKTLTKVTIFRRSKPFGNMVLSSHILLVYQWTTVLHFVRGNSSSSFLWGAALLLAKHNLYPQPAFLSSKLHGPRAPSSHSPCFSSHNQLRALGI